MINSALIKNLTVDDLDLLDAESLISPVVLAKLAELAEDSLFDLEPGQAKDYYESLNDSALQYQASFQNNPESFIKLNSILTSLFWKAFPALPAQLQKEALTNHVLLSLNNNVNIRYFLQKYLDIYEFIGPDMEQRKTLARFLQTNEEVLGTSIILISNKEKAQPKVKNWLTDYNGYSQFNNIKNTRGHYEQVKYLSTSPNIKTLTKTEQAVLFKLIELYDWLLFPGQIRTDIPLVKELPTRQTSIPGVTATVVPADAGEATRAGALASATKPLAATPKIGNNPPGIAPLVPPPVVNRGNVNLQDILNERMDSAKFGGVIWDNRPTNVDLAEVKKNVEQKRAETEAEIARKLEDLKKRKSS